jgi:hypothetical protein
VPAFIKYEGDYMVKNIVLIITIIFLLNCGENIFKEKVEFKYSNPIGAINITKGDNLKEGPLHWSVNSNYLIYIVDYYNNENHNIYYTAKRFIKDKFPFIYILKYYIGFLDSPPVVSPDGKWWVYSGKPVNQQFLDIYRVDSENPESEPERLTFNDLTDKFGRVSPDGEWLAFISQREPHVQTGSEVYIMKFEPEGENNQPIRITYYNDLSCWNILWSPDGEWLYYTHWDYNMDDKIYKIKPFVGIDSEEVINISGGIMVIPTDVSPDGKWIVLDYLFFNENNEYQSRIGYISSEAGEQEIHDFFPPLEWGCDCEGAAFSPDGNWIAFVSEMENPEKMTDIFLYPFNPDE